MGGQREYSYKVAAVNDDGTSSRTGEFVALVPANYLSNADTWRSHSLTATRSGSNVTLNWEVISTASVTGYKIRRKAVGARWETVVGNTVSGDRTYTDVNLTTGKTYKYKVRAHYEHAVTYQENEDGEMEKWGTYGMGTASNRAVVTIP